MNASADEPTSPLTPERGLRAEERVGPDNPLALSPSSSPDDQSQPGRPASGRAEGPGPVEERDLWWGSYDPRTMLPSFAFGLVLTVAVILTVHFVAAVYGLPAKFARYTNDGVLVVLWSYLVGRWIYRVVAYNYRLTTRRVFCETGFYLPPHTGIELARIAQVVVEKRPAERWLGLGRIRLILADEKRTVVLEAVRFPDQVAMTIRHQIELARAAPDN